MLMSFMLPHLPYPNALAPVPVYKTVLLVDQAHLDQDWQ